MIKIKSLFAFLMMAALSTSPNGQIAMMNVMYVT